jgi:hypothetical protein
MTTTPTYTLTPPEPRKTRKASKIPPPIMRQQALDYKQRVNALEAEGLCTSDAQAVIDAQDMRHTQTWRILI